MPSTTTTAAANFTSDLTFYVFDRQSLSLVSSSVCVCVRVRVCVCVCVRVCVCVSILIVNVLSSYYFVYCNLIFCLSQLSRACEIKNGFAGIIVKNSCTRRQKCGASKFQMNVFGIDSTVSFCTSIANTIRKGVNSLLMLTFMIRQIYRSTI